MINAGKRADEEKSRDSLLERARVHDEPDCAKTAFFSLIRLGFPLGANLEETTLISFSAINGRRTNLVLTVWITHATSVTN